ncbi:MAG: adenine deaminase [Deltaproteobacteria bacterium]|nr:MAG: adenine deaminase [Deltaproteobacteria bacterium]
MNRQIKFLEKRIKAGRGLTPSDLVLKGGKVINVFSGETIECDVAVQGSFIVGLGADYKGKEVVDVSGKWVVPGLIDAHMHLESTMLLPANLARALLPHGTTTIVSDPHEIANVAGLNGIRFLLKESEFIPLDIYFMAPSCVPATTLETSGAKIGISELRMLKKEPRVLGLAEMMNYPGVLAGEEDVLKKLSLFADSVIDGHAPLLKGYDLQGYISAGMRSDHETSGQNEAMEKLRSGMMIMIREGTSARNMDELLPLVSKSNEGRFCFVSDDLHPHDIHQRGHLDYMLRRAIEYGLDAATAVKLASLNPARYFGLKYKGAVAPGYQADLVVLNDLELFSVEKVYKEGRLVAENGVALDFAVKIKALAESLRPIRLASIKPDRFQIRRQGQKARVIQLVPGQIHTRLLQADVKTDNGLVQSDSEADILKVAVLERHHGSGRIGLGLVRGFGLKKGALASSVAHDSHNIVCVGVEDEDMFCAIKELKRIGGGMVAASQGRVLASVPLGVAGLISTEPLEDLVPKLEKLNRAAISLGCSIADPFMYLSFLALPVIPEVRITDRGLVDVGKFALVSLFFDEG